MREETGSVLVGKRIAILAEEGFEDSELVEPLRAMKDADARVVVVGSGSQESYRGKRGTATIKVDVTAAKVSATDFDAIVVPGGYAADKMRLHQSMIDLVRKTHDSDKVAAAICHGPQLLTILLIRDREKVNKPDPSIGNNNIFGESA